MVCVHKIYGIYCKWKIEGNSEIQVKKKSKSTNKTLGRGDWLVYFKT
jgi:hypothetical protein